MDDIIEPKMPGKEEFCKNLREAIIKKKKLKGKEVDNYKIEAKKRLKGIAPIKRKRGGYQ